MDILTHEAFHADLHNARKVGVLQTTRNGCTVMETVDQNLYSGNLWVQVDTTYGDGTVSTHYAEYCEEYEIKAFAERFQQQKKDAESTVV